MSSQNNHIVVIKEPWSIWKLLSLLPLILVVPLTLLGLYIIVSDTLSPPPDTSDDAARRASIIMLMFVQGSYLAWLFIVFLARRWKRTAGMN